jgi:hypothetical protein
VRAMSANHQAHHSAGDGPAERLAQHAKRSSLRSPCDRSGGRRRSDGNRLPPRRCRSAADGTSWRARGGNRQRRLDPAGLPTNPAHPAATAGHPAVQRPGRQAQDGERQKHTDQRQDRADQDHRRQPIQCQARQSADQADDHREFLPDF